MWRFTESPVAHWIAPVPRQLILLLTRTPKRRERYLPNLQREPAGASDSLSARKSVSIEETLPFIRTLRLLHDAFAQAGDVRLIATAEDNFFTINRYQFYFEGPNAEFLAWRYLNRAALRSQTHPDLRLAVQ